MKWIASSLFLSISAIAGGAEAYLTSRRQAQRPLQVSPKGNFNISIFHVNDIHAHLDEVTSSGTDCINPGVGCYGSYARIKAAVDAGRKAATNSLFLNMGDEFQGTLFYGFYGGEKIADTLNQLNFDAMTLGNHEFDQGDAYLGQFLDNLTIPIVCANIDSADPSINSTVKPYHIFPQYKLAVIGVTTDTIPSTSNADDSTSFADPISTAQYWADYVYAHEGVERVVLMTHIGYDVDIAMARNTTGIHLILGAHSHTLLGDMPGAAGPYPTVERNLLGEEVLVVTAYRYGEYLGHINVEFDPRGKVVSHSGGPIHLTNQSAQDPGLQAQVRTWRAPFDAFAGEVIGATQVQLSHDGCKTGECNFGDLVCDAMLDYRRRVRTQASTSGTSSTVVQGCFLNGGGIRVTLVPGNITRGDVLGALPFGNAVVEVSMTGRELWDLFAGAVSGAAITFAQISRGMRVTYNPRTRTLIDLEVEELLDGGGSGEMAVAVAGVDFGRTYRMVTSDYVAGGGDNIMSKQQGVVVLDTLDEVLTAYIQRVGSVDVGIQGRVVYTDETVPRWCGRDAANAKGCDEGVILGKTGYAVVLTLIGIVSALISRPFIVG